MPYEQVFAIAFGATFGAFLGWVILPWVFPQRKRKQAENRGEAVVNTEGPDTFAFQDATWSTVGDSGRKMRVGRKVGRTLYLVGVPDDYQHDKIVGIVDTAWLAREVCYRWNLHLEESEC